MSEENKDAGTGTGLAVIQTLTPMAIYASQADADKILEEIRKIVEDFKPDISTEEGRAAIGSFNRKVAISKTTMVNMGKTLTEEWRTKTKAVNAECNRIEAIFEGWQEKITGPLKEWKAKNEQRIAACEHELMAMYNLGQNTDGLAVVDLQGRIDELARIYKLERTTDLNVWEEFQERADGLNQTIGESLAGKLIDRKKYDSEQEELAKFRAAEAERVEKERLEQEKRDAEAKAQREKEEREAAEKAAADKARQEEQEKAERDKIAAAKAAQDEIDRKEQERIDAVKKAEQAEKDTKAAEAKAADDAKKAEQKRLDDIAEAVKKEQDRVAAQKKIDDDKAARREADKIHKEKINKQAIMSVKGISGVTEEQAVAIVSAIERKEVPNVTISY